MCTIIPVTYLFFHESKAGKMISITSHSGLWKYKTFIVQKLQSGFHAGTQTLFTDVPYRPHSVILMKADNFVAFHTNGVVRKAMANPDPLNLPLPFKTFYIHLELLHLCPPVDSPKWTVSQPPPQGLASTNSYYRSYTYFILQIIYYPTSYLKR